jgi:hypothetical protein
MKYSRKTSVGTALKFENFVIQNVPGIAIFIARMNTTVRTTMLSAA